MLPFAEYGAGEFSLIFMPFLGGSQREWLITVGLLSETHRCITVDLPGFGAASAIPGYSVNEMADAVIELLSSLKLGRYVLVGHSMAGKVSAVTTRRLITNGIPMAPPDGIVLVAPSPPGPEPMSDLKRHEMLNSLGSESPVWLAGHSGSARTMAEKFVRDNIVLPLPDDAFQQTVDGVLSMNPAAWVAWLKGGSKEDWDTFVGVIDLPALIVAGTKDEALGPEAQRTHTLPHFRSAQLAEVGCSHLVPLEMPAELASLVSNFLERMDTGASL